MTVTNRQSGTDVHEIADGIFRIDVATRAAETLEEMGVPNRVIEKNRCPGLDEGCLLEVPEDSSERLSGW